MRGFSLLSIENEVLEPDDVIIAGVSYEEGYKFNKLLAEKGLHNVVYYNTIPMSLVTHETILSHKKSVLLALPLLDVFYENDKSQCSALQETFPGMHIINK